MDKKAFSSVLRFMKAKPWLIVGMIAAMFVVTFGEQMLSDVLRDVELTCVDWGLGVIRLILQTVLSVALVYAWHKDRNEAAPFSAVDIPKLFVTTLVTVVCVTFLMVTVVLIPLAVFLYLRFDFYMNTYITGRSNGVFSCVGESFRMTKGRVRRYFVFNVKYLAFYFLVETVLFLLSFLIGMPEELRAALVPGLADVSLSDGLSKAVDVVYVIFMSVFMPYRFLLKCGYYDEVLKTED